MPHPGEGVHVCLSACLLCTDAIRLLQGKSKSATLEEIEEHGFVHMPGRCVGAEDVEEEGIASSDKMATLTSELADPFTESTKLEKAIRKNMKALGFELPVGGSK